MSKLRQRRFKETRVIKNDSTGPRLEIRIFDASRVVTKTGAPQQLVIIKRLKQLRSRLGMMTISSLLNRKSDRKSVV